MNYWTIGKAIDYYFNCDYYYEVNVNDFFYASKRSGPSGNGLPNIREICKHG